MNVHYILTFLVKHYINGICKALNILHGLDTPIAHRDIKPANIMISDDNNAILMDFGSACEARCNLNSNREALLLQELCEATCSILYRAPELFEILTPAYIDERTDIWSLGCTLFTIAFAKSPFEGAFNDSSIKLAVMNGKITFPNNNYSESITQLITWLCNLDPKKRPYASEILAKL